MRQGQRDQFDTLLQRILNELPLELQNLIEQVPLVVEDYPDPQVLEELEVDSRDALCGLHDGIPLTERSPLLSDDDGLPEQIILYREGISAAAADETGRVPTDELQRQIRITVLHEIGHHFGLTEKDLAELGYD